MQTYKTMKCRVMFPQDFSVDVPDDLSTEDKIKFIKDYAGYLMETSQSEPEIESCDDVTIESECYYLKNSYPIV